MQPITLRDIGEKKLIAEIVAPLFNLDGPARRSGAGCAMFQVPPEHDVLASTERILADSIGFWLAVLEFDGLGDYLGRLILSEMAAAAATPLGLLFDARLRPDMAVRDFQALCNGIRGAAMRSRCRVVGANITLGPELSLSTTALGAVPAAKGQTRTQATAGDLVYATRPVGLAAAAFAAFGRQEAKPGQSPTDLDALKEQFESLEPMLSEGVALRHAGASAAMANKEGLGQCLIDLADAAQVAVVVDRAKLALPELVVEAANSAGVDPVRFALGPGGDFSLVCCAPETATNHLPQCAQPIGRVYFGTGAWLDSEGWWSDLAAEGCLVPKLS